MSIVPRGTALPTEGTAGTARELMENVRRRLQPTTSLEYQTVGDLPDDEPHPHIQHSGSSAPSTASSGSNASSTASSAASSSSINSQVSRSSVNQHLSS